MIIPCMSVPHVVIIGGGFGGLWAAKALQHAPVRVTLVDRHNHHVFQPLLYQVATAALSPGDIASPIRWILRRQRNTRVLLAEARNIDTAASRVDLDHGESLSYDYLIVAAGSSSSYFGHDDWKANAPSLKTLDDALQIRGRMLLAYEIAEREDNPELRRMLLTFVIVGGILRIVPLTGITMPFVSYGGTSIVANFVMLALLMLVSHRAVRHTRA